MTGCVLIDIEGAVLSAQEAELLALPQVAGILLFAKNYMNRDQLVELVRSIRHHRPDALVMVDQEGGLIQRFGPPDFEAIPSAWALGQKGVEACREWGEKMARDLLSCGIDASFAPVLDVHDPASPIIGQKERAFSDDPQQVVACAEAWIQGMRAAGMPAVGKHFPGHGRHSLDSHVDVIISDQTLPELESGDMQPFSMLKGQLAGLMLAHITYPNIDSEVVGGSALWQQYIREHMGYDGCLVSDCLSMVGSAFDTIDERASMVQYWVDKLRHFSKVCDLVILTHITDGSYDPELDVAKFEQILLTAFPSDYLESRTNRLQALRGQLAGDFCG